MLGNKMDFSSCVTWIKPVTFYHCACIHHGACIDLALFWAILLNIVLATLCNVYCGHIY